METKIGHQENDPSSSSLDMKTGGAVLLSYPLERDKESPPSTIFFGSGGYSTPVTPLCSFRSLRSLHVK